MSIGEDQDEGTLAFVRSELLVIKEKINSLLLKIDVGLGFRGGPGL